MLTNWYSVLCNEILLKFFVTCVCSSDLSWNEHLLKGKSSVRWKWEQALAMNFCQLSSCSARREKILIFLEFLTVSQDTVYFWIAVNFLSEFLHTFLINQLLSFEKVQTCNLITCWGDDKFHSRIILEPVAYFRTCCHRQFYAIVK